MKRTVLETAPFVVCIEKPTANSQWPTANSQQPMANGQQPTANSQWPTANSQSASTGIIRYIAREPNHSTEHHHPRMDFLTLLFIAFALAIDAFAVSLSTGAYLKKADARQTFRMAFHFGLFQFLMPVIGWAAGTGFASLIQAADHWIAFGLLALIGGRMIVNAFRGEPEDVRGDVTKGWSLISLSVATSIDALAVGLSLSFIDVHIILPAVLIGIVAGGMSVLGIRLGERISGAVGKHMEYIGGIILILIGMRILFEHLSII